MDAPLNLRAVAGHNAPPSLIEFIGDMRLDLSRFMAATPVIQTEDVAREAARLITRAKKSLLDLNAERDALVRPLNSQVDEINDRYNRQARNPLKRVLDELEKRLSDYATAEERRRQCEAKEKQQLADEAARLAREAEANERDALDDAAVGILGVDVAAVATATDEAFHTAEKAERAAALAERNVPVRLGTGIGRAVTLRSTEVLIVTNPDKALACLGMTEDIREAMLKSARAYRKLRGTLPEGVAARTERRI